MNGEDRAREVLASLHTGKKRARLLHGPISYAGGISPSVAIRAMLAFTAATPTETPESEGAIPAGMVPIADAALRPSTEVVLTPKGSQAPNQGVQALADRSADGEALASFVAGPVWKEAEDDCWTSEVQVVGGHEVVATVHGATEIQAIMRRDAVLAALTSHAGEVRSPAPVRHLVRESFKEALVRHRQTGESEDVIARDGAIIFSEKMEAALAQPDADHAGEVDRG
jgi:hypothetical protein